MWILTRLRVKLKSCPGRHRVFHPLPAALQIKKRKTVLSSPPRASAQLPRSMAQPHKVPGPNSKAPSRGWTPPPLDRKDKAAFPSVLATPDLMERNNCQALKCADLRTDLSGLLSPYRLSVDGQHCGQRKGTQVLRVKGWNLEAKRFKPTAESKGWSRLLSRHSQPEQLSALFLRNKVN